MRALHAAPGRRRALLRSRLKQHRSRIAKRIVGRSRTIDRGAQTNRRRYPLLHSVFWLSVVGFAALHSTHDRQALLKTVIECWLVAGRVLIDWPWLCYGLQDASLPTLPK